jgi:hypothetical protein
MTIVIDVGCARYGNDYSIERLIEEFHPAIIYGFDPNQGRDEYPWTPNPPGMGPTGPTHATAIHIEKKAAWIYDGEIGFQSDGLNSWVTEMNGAPRVPCFDLARFISEEMPYYEPSHEIILKIDAEGAEYDLLRHLISRGADKLLKLAWVEWHQPDRGRAEIEQEIACELMEWNW